MGFHLNLTLHIMLHTILCSLSLFAAEPCTSGVPVGQRPTPYSFLVATGPQRGQQTCYICEQADKPTVVVFARHLTDPLGKLMAKLDAEVPTHKESGFKVWLTHLTDKGDLNELAKWSQKQAIKNAPVGVLEDADGPPAYKLNPDADITVLFFVKQKVVANFAYRTGELTDDKMAEVLKGLPLLFEKK